MKKLFKGCMMLLLLSIFLTGCGSGVEDLLPNPNDDTAPTVLTTVPADGALNVATNRKIIVTFDEAMRPSSITAAGTFTLTGPGGAVAGEVTYNVINHVAIFTPSALLTAGLHTATITNAAEDVSGNALAAAKTWSFTVGVSADIIKPEVISISPADKATGVPGNTDINVIFSEVMDPETVTITTFTLETSAGPIPVPGIVTCTGTAATLNPTVALIPGVEYIARVTIEVADLAGNTLLIEKEWSFTTN